MHQLEAEAANERKRQECLECVKKLRPLDDTLMRRIFKDDLPLTEMVLRIITEKQDLILLKCQVQANMERVTGSRGVYLDVYATDSTGKKYDIEVQRDNAGAGAHRARYLASIMDVEHLSKGQDFDQLPDTYVIFITEKDIYEQGLALYPVRRINEATSKPFDDGSYIIYVNSQYKGDDPIGRLMHDFNCSKADDMYYEALAEKVRYWKETEEGVSQVCGEFEKLLYKYKAEWQAEGEAKGRAEGKAEGKAEGLTLGKVQQAMATAMNMKQKGLTASFIADCLGTTEAQVKEWLAGAAV